MALELIQSHLRDLGDGFMVRRLLPQIGRKMVGPFIFLDHMGPAVFKPGTGLDVRPHPHINLATVTYLFSGEILHRDSLGSEQLIRPGDVNWMTAGRGIVHSERSPDETRQKGGQLEGIQCWVALPREHEETEPSFVHHPGHTLPQLMRDGVAVRVLLGSAYGQKSPVRTFSDTLYLDLKMPKGSRLHIPADEREKAVYAAHGLVTVNGEDVLAQGLAIGPALSELRLEARETARVLVVGGARLPEKREIWWNFVSSSKERIEQAKADWSQGRFPKVPGDESESIPLPSEAVPTVKTNGTVM